MIGFAVVARRFISPREVLQSAPLTMRVQFWGLVISGVAIATVTVSARGEIVQQAAWLPYWPVFVVTAGWLVSAGYVLAKFDAFKARLDALEATTQKAFEGTVKKDVLAETLAGLKADIAHVRQLLERDRDWRDMHHGSKE